MHTAQRLAESSLNASIHTTQEPELSPEEAFVQWSEVGDFEDERPGDSSWRWAHRAIFAIFLGCIAAAIFTGQGF
jgi:hypothetical protein